MKVCWNRRRSFAASIGLLLGLLCGAGCTGSALAMTGSEKVPALETIRTAHFAEPLVARAPTTPAEDLALSQALTSFRRRSTPDVVSALTAFLSRYPHSGW